MQIPQTIRLDGTRHTGSTFYGWMDQIWMAFEENDSDYLKLEEVLQGPTAILWPGSPKRLLNWTSWLKQFLLGTASCACWGCFMYCFNVKVSIGHEKRQFLEQQLSSICSGPRRVAKENKIRNNCPLQWILSSLRFSPSAQWSTQLQWYIN